MTDTASSIPKEGTVAPDFKLPASSGREIRLSDLRGQSVVLYFYPKDDTPGCTLEAKEFKALKESFSDTDTVILGISPDSVDSHCKFASKYGLNFDLLADEAHSVAEKYGVWTKKNRYGKESWGVQRSTFLVGPDGTIQRTWPKVKPDGHAQSVLAAINS